MDVQIACPCPPKANGSPRHVSDTVTLKERLGFREALTARNVISQVKANDVGATADELTPYILAGMTEQYVLSGIAEWTLVDAENKPIPVSRGAIRAAILVNDEASSLIADAADDLYRDQVLAPFTTRARPSSPPSSMDESTSAMRSIGEPEPTPSRPSSTSTSQTDGIATITLSPVGGSKSSRRSVTAA